jgi:FAD/FMN-containing dehydrogenase
MIYDYINIGGGSVSFAGSEATLGIITAAAMKLAPLPRVREVAFCSLDRTCIGTMDACSRDC